MGGRGPATAAAATTTTLPTGGSSLLSLLPYEWGSLLAGLRKTDSSSPVGNSSLVHTREEQQDQPPQRTKAEQLPSASLEPSEHNEDVMKAALALATFSPLAMGTSTPHELKP